jgi:hypothetical protein
LQWKDVLAVMNECEDRESPGRLFTIETNGTVYEEAIARRVYLSMSPKFEPNMIDQKIKPYSEQSVLDWIRSRTGSNGAGHLKFVVETRQHFDQILEWLRKVPSEQRGNIALIFQPEWFKGKEDFKQVLKDYAQDGENFRALADYGFKEVRFQPQMHKILAVR